MILNKIKEITEFAKMFKLNIPVKEHFEYYIQTLSHSFEFKNIVSLVNNYAEFEEWLESNGYNNVGHYKMSFAYDKLKNYILNSEAYERCLNFDYSNTKFYEKDNLKINEGNYMLSLDFTSANFQSVKIFDKENKLKNSWKDLCEYLEIHPMIAESKSFRQVVFGNLNPKRFEKIQHYHILRLVDSLNQIFPSEDIIFISHDELVMNLGNDMKIASERISQITEAVKKIKEDCLFNCELWMNVSPTIFEMNKISKGVYVKTIFTQTKDSIIEAYKTLYGCPGNLYYMNFKKYILESEIDERDCFFMVENHLAKWVV